MWKETIQSPYYLVNENGDVKRKEYTRVDKIGRKTLMEEKMLKQHYDRDGYKRVTLISGLKKPIFIQVHKLVAQAFVENPNNYTQVNHKDEDKTNNDFNNLEWCTVEYNNNYGKRNEKAKNTLIEKLGKKVIASKDNKEFLFNSVGEASRTLGVNTSNIFNCLKGKLQKTGGYTFKEVV